MTSFSEEEKLLHQLTQKDSRCETLGIKATNVKKALEQVVYSAKLPEEIKKQLEMCKKLFQYSYFVYEFASVAEQRAFLVVEGALKEKLRLFYSEEFQFRNKETKEIINIRPNSLGHFQSILNEHYLLPKDGYFERGVSLRALLEWVVGKKIYEERHDDENDALANVRNHCAHPIGFSFTTPPNAFSLFKIVVNFLNQIFDSPVTQSSSKLI